MEVIYFLQLANKLAFEKELYDLSQQVVKCSSVIEQPKVIDEKANLFRKELIECQNALSEIKTRSAMMESQLALAEKSRETLMAWKSSKMVTINVTVINSVIYINSYFIKI